MSASANNERIATPELIRDELTTFVVEDIQSQSAKIRVAAAMFSYAPRDWDQIPESQRNLLEILQTEGGKLLGAERVLSSSNAQERLDEIEKIILPKLIARNDDKESLSWISVTSEKAILTDSIGRFRLAERTRKIGRSATS